MRRWIRRIGQWGFTIVIVPKRGGVRRVVVPWLGVIGSVLLLVYIVSGLVYYPYSHMTLRQLRAINSRLEKENKKVKPALNRTRQLEGLVDDYEKTVDAIEQTYQTIRRKSSTGLTSRSGSYRHEAYRLPKPVVTPDGKVSLLGTLETNTDSLLSEIARRKAEAEALQVKLLAYDRQLDHTPSVWPVWGRMTSRFGYRRDPFTKRSTMHGGIDLVVGVGTTVRASADGVVVEAGWQGGYGWRVVIDHGYGYRTAYAHNSALLVTAGQKVKKGQAIARSGSSGKSTGPHVHFETFVNGRCVNPLTIL